jgi:hypothetical protein
MIIGFHISVAGVRYWPLSWANRIQYLYAHPFEVHFINDPSTPRSAKWSLRVFLQNLCLNQPYRPCSLHSLTVLWYWSAEEWKLWDSLLSILNSPRRKNLFSLLISWLLAVKTYVVNRYTISFSYSKTGSNAKASDSDGQYEVCILCLLGDNSLCWLHIYPTKET